MTDPLGQSQVLSYLKKLSARYSFDVLAYEKPEVYEAKKHQVEAFIEGYDIRWLAMPYTKSPPIVSSMYDFYKGWQTAKKFGDERPYDVVHSRSSMIGNIALAAQKRYGAKLIFDMRGWWADEKRDSGNWASPVYKPVYKYFKDLETELFHKSDHSISLTHVGYDEILRLKLKEGKDVSVIPTCVNFDVFKHFDAAIRSQVRDKLYIGADDTVLLYSGSLGGNYSMEVIFGLYKAFKKVKPATKILLLTRTDRQFVEAEVQQGGVSLDDVRIQASDYQDVHKYLMAGDFGIVNYQRSYSTIGRSPTKLGEYWACGMPVVSESNIADIDYLVNRYPGSGYLIGSLEEALFDEAVTHLMDLKTSKDQLREFSEDYYDIDKGVDTYMKVYEKVLADK